MKMLGVSFVKNSIDSKTRCITLEKREDGVLVYGDKLYQEVEPNNADGVLSVTPWSALLPENFKLGPVAPLEIHVREIGPGDPKSA